MLESVEALESFQKFSSKLFLLLLFGEIQSKYN